MKRNWSGVYALACALLMIAGYITVFVFAWKTSTPDLARAVAGLALGFFFAPIFHELGHILFAKTSNMAIAYTKCFCFKWTRKGKRFKFGFVSPFLPDETQTVPKNGGDMLARAKAYTAGGLVLGGIFLFVDLVCALVTTLFFTPNYLFWGILPYAAYLFFLNALPFEYPTGKTDALVLRGLKKGEDAEKTMLSAMEIQGRLYAGDSYADIDEKLFFDTPQLPENEPLFAVMLDLRYRYYLEKDDLKNAADCLNRLVVSQDYLAEEEQEKLAAECVYMHALNGDLERAEECGQLCQGYLRGESAAAKRILAAFSSAFGKTNAVAPLKGQAENALDREWIAGNAKFERKLLEKIDCE